MMRYGQIRRYDVANGPGIRSSIFVTGCSHRCPACFNQEYQDFSYGKIWTHETSKLVLSYLQDPHVAGLTILGGEPFDNTEGLIELLTYIRENSDKNIWIYSGYLLEDILSDDKKRELLFLTDVLVDGPFIEEKKNLKLKFRGSENQRIIDVNKLRETP